MRLYKDTEFLLNNAEPITKVDFVFIFQNNPVANIYGEPDFYMSKEPYSIVCGVNTYMTYIKLDEKYYKKEMTAKQAKNACKFLKSIKA